MQPAGYKDHEVIEEVIILPSKIFEIKSFKAGRDLAVAFAFNFLYDLNKNEVLDKVKSFFNTHRFLFVYLWWIKATTTTYSHRLCRKINLIYASSFRRWDGWTMFSNEFKVLVYVLSLRRYVPAISIQLHAISKFWSAIYTRWGGGLLVIAAAISFCQPPSGCVDY